MRVDKSSMLFFLFSSCFLLLFVNGQTQHSILLDGNFSDWSETNLQYQDVSGDAPSQTIDFGRLWLESDDTYVYVRFELGKEINLQNDNEVVLYFDTDNNSSTGFSFQGIGAEIRYFPGRREGFLHLNGGQQQIGHSILGFISLPTVSADVFELHILRQINAQIGPIVMGNEISIAIANDIANGDVLPSESGGLVYPLNDNTLAFDDPKVNKAADVDFRVMSYNVLFDGLFKSGQQGPIAKILNALAPDIIGFQEIYNHTGEEVRNVVANLIPAPVWYFSSVAPDIHLLSKYPILQSEALDGNGAFLVDRDGQQMLVIVAHLPCCANDENRQNEIDQIMAFVRDSENSLGSFQLPYMAPIIIMGDMNLVGFSEQVTTLIDGDIENNNTYGADFEPNWGDGSLLDVAPLATGLPAAVTWINSGSFFAPGKLDYIIYGGGVSCKNSLGFYTPGLNSTLLNELGLLSTDSEKASDHIPIVADFSLELSTSIAQNSKLGTFEIFPNPATDFISVNLKTRISNKVDISLFDISGKIVQRFEVIHDSDDEPLKISIAHLPAALYYLQINNEVRTFIKN